MDAWRLELTIAADYIRYHRVVMACDRERVVGFYGLEFRERVAYLEHLWVEPDLIGAGAGRALLAKACNDARNRGYGVVELVADPNAEPFYLRQGAIRIGEARGSILGTPRVLPRMQLSLASSPRKNW
jgi:GNAT superfamily N-acetyltransferase